MKLLLGATIGSAASVLAQITPGGPDLWAPLLNLGTVGVVLVLMLAGKIVPGRSHDRVLGERDQLAAELREYNRAERAEVIPLMTRNTEALARVAAILAELERGRP